MTKTRFSLTAAATLVLSTTFLSAQSAPADSGQAAKPSPYQGVSVPPSNDAITTTEQAPAVVNRPAPAAAPAPAPAAPSNPDAGIVETPLPPSAEGSAPHSSAAVHAPSFDSS